VISRAESKSICPPVKLSLTGLQKGGNNGELWV